MHIITSSKALKDRDESDFKMFFQRGVPTGRVVYHSDCKFTIKQGELVIVDEADLFMYEQYANFFKMVKAASLVVCMTATASDKGWLD